MQNRNNIGVVILAAGDGTRMQSDVPKVMHKLDGKPLIAHVVEHVKESDCCRKPIIVVSPKHTLVQDYLGDQAEYVVQTEQLGTGHAAYAAKPLITAHASDMLVLYGDMPNLSPESIQRLTERHTERSNTITMMTVTVPHFDGMYSPFEKYGRIIRDPETGHIQKSIEYKDATDTERAVKEVNPGYYCFDTSWFFDNYTRINNNNAQQEYYLPDLLALAIADKEKISSITIEPKEAVGVNTQADLQLLKNT